MRKPLMNICQPENPAEFLVGGERWTIEDLPPMANGPWAIGGPATDMSQFDNYFELL
jgi:hypothetical protein